MGKTPIDSTLVQQEEFRKQILLTELDGEIQKLIEHYHITEEMKGKAGTTTLAEIGAVVYRARRRADAYTKVLNELYRRTGYKLDIMNNKIKSKKEEK